MPRIIFSEILQIPQGLLSDGHHRWKTSIKKNSTGLSTPSLTEGLCFLSNTSGVLLSAFSQERRAHQVSIEYDIRLYAG